MPARTYDSLGFPIPVEFDPAAGGADVSRSPSAHRDRTSSSGRRRPTITKRVVVLAIIVMGVIPLAVGPTIVSEFEAAVTQWSLERARWFEVRDEAAAAVGELDRVIGWFGEDAELLCIRASLRMDNRDLGGARRDASRAAELSPMEADPLRIRAIVHASLGNVESAVADVERACAIVGEADPQGVNLRSYVRALVCEDLQQAYDDIDQLVRTLGEPPPEFIDTRGYLLHLLGRHEESVRDLEDAIERMREMRRQVTLLGGRIHPLDLARRLRLADHSLAVMIHHRGLALAALGREAEAAADFAMAVRKGYDPGRGIF